jgi:hypothetical protein
MTRITAEHEKDQRREVGRRGERADTLKIGDGRECLQQIRVLPTLKGTQHSKPYLDFPIDHQNCHHKLIVRTNFNLIH